MIVVIVDDKYTINTNLKELYYYKIQGYIIVNNIAILLPKDNKQPTYQKDNDLLRTNYYLHITRAQDSIRTHYPDMILFLWNHIRKRTRRHL